MAGEGWSSLIQLVLALSLPWLLRQAASLLKQTPDTKKKVDVPYTRLDSVVRWVLLAAMVSQLVYAFVWTPPNVLASLRVGAGEPSFVLRNKVWEYTEKGYGAQYAKQVLGEGSEAETSELPAGLLRMRLLYSRLKEQSNRFMYLKFGEAAFVSCEWCQEGQDYMLNIFPAIALQYLLMYFVVTLATSTRRKRTWWTWANVALVAIFLFVDVAQFGGSDDEFIQKALDRNVAGQPITWASTFCRADRWRHIGFALLSFLMLLRDGSLERTENEIARDVVVNNQVVLNHLNAYRLQQNSILNDDALRRAYTDFYRARAIEADLVAANPEYDSVRREAIQKHSLEKLLNDQALTIDRLVCLCHVSRKI